MELRATSFTLDHLTEVQNVILASTGLKNFRNVIFKTQIAFVAFFVSENAVLRILIVAQIVLFMTINGPERKTVQYGRGEIKS